MSPVEIRPKSHLCINKRSPGHSEGSMLDPVTRKRKVPKERRTCPARSHFAAFVTSCMVFSNCLNPSLEFGAKAWKNELSTQPDIPLATPIIRELLTYES